MNPSSVREFPYSCANPALAFVYSIFSIGVNASKNVANRSMLTKATERISPFQRTECAQVAAVSVLLWFRGVAQFDSSAALGPFCLAGWWGSFFFLAQQWIGLLFHGFSVGQSTQSFNHSS